jgi:hypothetical protein
MPKLSERQKEINKKQRAKKELSLTSEQYDLYERMRYLIEKPERNTIKTIDTL